MTAHRFRFCHSALARRERRHRPGLQHRLDSGGQSLDPRHAKGADIAGAYMTLSNKGTAPDRLIGGSSPVAGRFELHLMTVEDGVMKMRPVDGGLEIKPGATVELKPGSFHIMLMGLKQPLEKGQKVKGTLVFEKAGTVEIEYAVEALGASSPAPGGRPRALICVTIRPARSPCDGGNPKECDRREREADIPAFAFACARAQVSMTNRSPRPISVRVCWTEPMRRTSSAVSWSPCQRMPFEIVEPVDLGLVTTLDRGGFEISARSLGVINRSGPIPVASFDRGQHRVVGGRSDDDPSPERPKARHKRPPARSAESPIAATLSGGRCDERRVPLPQSARPRQSDDRDRAGRRIEQEGPEIRPRSRRARDPADQQRHPDARSRTGCPTRAGTMRKQNTSNTPAIPTEEVTTTPKDR